jgi:galactonate dehydratase/gluconate/galactonate dehydratase
MLMRSGGAGAIAGVTFTPASDIEIVLWDLAGHILQTRAMTTCSAADSAILCG